MHHSIVMVMATMLGCDDYIFGEQVVDAGAVPLEEGLAGVEEIVNEQCLGCHSESQSLGGLDLESDLVTNTVDVVGQYNIPIVLPGDPENSMFYRKITNTQDGQGADMPPGTGGLSSVVADLVYDWIVSLEDPVE